MRESNAWARFPASPGAVQAACYLSAGKRRPEELAVNRVEDGGQHDRTPLFDLGHCSRPLFQASFVGWGKWFR